MMMMMMMGFGVQRRGVNAWQSFFSFTCVTGITQYRMQHCNQSYFTTFFPSCIHIFFDQDIVLMRYSPLHWSFLLLSWMAQTTTIYAMPQFNEGLFFYQDESSLASYH